MTEEERLRARIVWGTVKPIVLTGGVVPVTTTIFSATMQELREHLTICVKNGWSANEEPTFMEHALTGEMMFIQKIEYEGIEENNGYNLKDIK